MVSRCTELLMLLVAVLAVDGIRRLLRLPPEAELLAANCAAIGDNTGAGGRGTISCDGSCRRENRMQTSDTCSARTWGGRGEEAEDFVLLWALSAAAVALEVVSSASSWRGNDESSSAASMGLGERRGEPATKLKKTYEK